MSAKNHSDSALWSLILTLIHHNIYINCYMNMKHCTDSVFVRTLSC